MARLPRRVPVPPLTDAMYNRGKRTGRGEPFDVVAAGYNRKTDALDLTLRKGIGLARKR